MLRVEKQLTDLGLVQGQNKTNEQGSPLGNKAQSADQAQLFQSELLSVIGNQAQSEAMIEGQTEQSEMLPEQLLAAREAIMKDAEASLEKLPTTAKESEKGSTSEAMLSLLKKPGTEAMTQEQVAAEAQALNKNIKSEINVLKNLLNENADKVNVKVVEADTPEILRPNTAQVGKMTSPWSLKNILKENDIPLTREEAIVQDFNKREEKKNADLKINKDLNSLDKKVIAELGQSNAKIKQAKSMQQFNAFKQNNPFKNALMNETVDLQKSGPQVYEGDQKAETISDFQKNNLMNLGQHGAAMNATHKLATNMTFKSAPEVELSKVNEVSQKIIDYIKQNAKVDNGNVEVQFRHEALGDIVLKVNEADKGIVNINLQSLQKQGADFFKSNQAEIIDVLTRSGIKVADFNVTQSSSTESNSSWSFEGNSQGQQQGQHKGQQQQQDTERRKQMWQQYQNQEAA